MTYPSPVRVSMTALALMLLSSPLSADRQPDHPSCKRIEATLVETPSTTGCKPEHTSCFLGEARGNRGFRASTYFKGDSAGVAPPATPDFLPYSGRFEYTTSHGTLVMRETGLTNQSQGNPESGAVTAYQKVVEATGDLAGSTGYFFVSGFNRDGRILTRVFGEICTP